MHKNVWVIFLLAILELVGSGQALAGKSYTEIYPGQLNEIEISTNETNQIKCVEAIKKISFDKDIKKDIDFSFKDNVANIRYKGRQNILMLVETTQRIYTILLKPTVGVGPRLLIAKPLTDEKGKDRHEYLSAEGTNRVLISNREVNRIVCDDKSAVIEKIKLPEDSGILTEIDGNDAFLQYWGRDEVLIEIKTTDSVYRVVLKPADISARIYMLKNSKKIPVVELYGNTREEIAVKLIKAALTNGPELKRATIKRNDQVVKTVDQIEFVEHIQYEFSSEEIFLVEYWLRTKKEKIRVEEEDILKLGILTDNTMGVCLDEEYLYPDKITRLFIVGSH